MTALYKIYSMVLAERIKKDCEEKRVITQNQTGFRKGMGTIDNIYVINYLVNKQLEKGKKAVVLFVDMKAAFDSVDRKILHKTMKERGIREGLIEKVKEVFRETKSRVKIGGQLGESFWTARGVRQGCLMLFNIVIVDLEGVMQRIKWGGMEVEEERIYSLTDDIITGGR